MIHLKAFLAESGKAIIQKDSLLLHIEPPYDLDSQTPVDYKSYDLALFEGQYKESDLSFETSDELIDFLMNEYEIWKQRNSFEENEIIDSAIFNNISGPFLDIFIEDLNEQLKNEKYRLVICHTKDLMSLTSNDALGEKIEEIKKLNSAALKLAKDKVKSETILFPNIKSEILIDQVFLINCTEKVDLIISRKAKDKIPEFV